MPKMCAAPSCSNAVFGKGYCKNHQYMRADFDRRTPAQKFQDKVKDGTAEKAKVSQRGFASIENVDLDESMQNLIEDLDREFSRFIRLKSSDKYGMVRCYTSDKLMHWKTAQCGHWVSRKHLATRWMEDNCRPQSQYDNCYLSGNLEVFAKNLEAEKPGITSFLLEQAREVVKPTREEMKGMIADYRKRNELLLSKLEKPKP
jgi:lipoate-protein ligase A